MERSEDGQHRQSPGSGGEDGQRRSHLPGTQVSQSRGADTSTRSLPKDADVSTETGDRD